MPLGLQEKPCLPFLEAVERRLSRQAFETWFRPLHVSRSGTQSVLQITAPNALVKDWILAQYAQTLQDSLDELRLDKYRLEWALPDGNAAGEAAPPDIKTSASIQPSPLPRPLPSALRATDDSNRSPDNSPPVSLP